MTVFHYTIAKYIILKYNVLDSEIPHPYKTTCILEPPHGAAGCFSTTCYAENKLLI